MEYTEPIDMPRRKGNTVSLSMRTLACGALALVAGTVAVTNILTAPTTSVTTTTKFMPTFNSRSSTAMFSEMDTTSESTDLDVEAPVEAAAIPEPVATTQSDEPLYKDWAPGASNAEKLGIPAGSYPNKYASWRPSKGKFGVKPEPRKGLAPGSFYGGSYKHQRKYDPKVWGEDSGVLPPFGMVDPLDFSRYVSPARARWFKEAELKHGRVAMLAALGFWVAENPNLQDAFFPGSGLNSDLASHTFTDHKLDDFWAYFVSVVGIIESQFIRSKMKDGLNWELKDDYAVGDLGFDPLGFKPKDAEQFKKTRTQEIQNGRLAMLGIAGMNAQEMTDGKPIFPIHGLESASAEELSNLNEHVQKGLELAKEMGHMLAETQTH